MNMIMALIVVIVEKRARKKRYLLLWEEKLILRSKIMQNIKDDVKKVKNLLGLNGDKSEPEKYYNVTDVLIALMHFCDKNKNGYNWDFEHHLESAREGYEEERGASRSRIGGK